MFTTYRPNKERQLITLRQSDYKTHLACNACRTKKIKCSGEREGCDRCKSRNLSCDYHIAARVRKRKRSKGLENAGTAIIPDIDSSDLNVRIAVAQASNVETSTHVLPVDQCSGEGPSVIQGPAFSSFSDAAHTFMNHPDHEDIFESQLLEVPDLWSGLPNFWPSDLATNFPDVHPSSEKNVTSNSSQVPSDPRLSPCESQCHLTALSLLERVSIQETWTSTPHLTITTVPSILKHAKSTLSHLPTLLSCHPCLRTSSFITLLILIAQKLISSYEDTILILGKQHQKLKLCSLTPEVRHQRYEAIVGQEDECRRILVRDYQVDVEEEPCMYGGLVTLQLARFERFVVRLEKATREGGWEGLVMMVEKAKERIVAQQMICGRSDC